MFNLKEIFEVSLRKMPYMQVQGFGPTVGLCSGNPSGESITLHYELRSKSLIYVSIGDIQVYTKDLEDSLSDLEVGVKESLERAAEDRISEHVVYVLNSMG